MAHGEVEPLTAEGPRPGAVMQPQLQQQQQQQHANLRRNVSAMGSRRIFSPSFKLQVLDSYRHDVEVKGNQRATARKYSIHRRQIQKWLQCEDSLRSSCGQQQQQQQQQQQPADSPSSTSSSSSSSASSTSSSCSTSSGASSTTASPAASPLKELEPLAPAAAGHSGAPASPTLNLGFARLRGDTELGARQSAPPPPPPPPPSQPVSAAAAAAAAQAIAQAQQQAAGYQQQRLHVPAHVQQPYPRLLHHHHHHHQSEPLHFPELGPELYPGQLHLHQHQHQHRLVEPKREPFSPPRFASPEPSQLESLPPSPERSCSAASSDSEMDGGQTAGRRRSFPLRFKIDVLDAFHGEAEVAGNQRATARKFRINRRQVQKWLGQETELRGVAELGQGRQRLGPQPELAPTPPDCYDYPALTPPYTEQPPLPPLAATVLPAPSSELKRPLYALDAQDAPPPPPPPKRFCPVQEQPLCLVKPKGSTTSAAAPNKDAILFKPYLDNPVSKREPTPPAANNNNNSPDAYNLNDAAPTHQQLSLQLSFNPPLNWQQQQPQHHHQYADVQPVRSAFVRYPTSVHYS